MGHRTTRVRGPSGAMRHTDGPERRRSASRPSSCTHAVDRRRLPRVTPETRYARRGDLHLAYQVLGDGPVDLLLVDQWFSHMEAQWDVAAARRRLRERLASFGRLIMFDKRGTGLSDPVSTSAAADDRRVDGRRDRRPRRGRLRTGGADHQHRRRAHGDGLRRRPPRARLAPRARRLLRPVPRGARLPDRRSSRGPRAGPRGGRRRAPAAGS